MVNQNESVHKIDELWRTGKITLAACEGDFESHLGSDWKKKLIVGKYLGISLEQLKNRDISRYTVYSDQEKSGMEDKMQMEKYMDLLRKTPQEVIPFLNTDALKESCKTLLENSLESGCVFMSIFGEGFIIFRN